ncbi:hypothetical protein RRG08_053076 [Elysia crispata]|uniref:Agglutinin n=1 Tax=Elysia crispata TaxID=231223 RepID=A0AAE1E6M5_9GAST|nr:hypothetical protein RRG08_053076 [Elysia crispata]
MATRIVRPLSFFLVTLAVSLFGGVEGRRYDTEWRATFIFQCPNGKVLNRLYSIFNSSKYDRIWQFGCSSAPMGRQLTNCRWMAWSQASGFSRTVKHGTGASDSNVVDKQAVSTIVFFTCYVNALGATMDFTVPPGKVLIGAYSEHNNHTEDRLWKFRHCQVD